MQDNSCQIDLDENHSIQKPKQIVSFNAKGKLEMGQGAAQKTTRNAQESRNQNRQIIGEEGKRHMTENLNDIELPRQCSMNIKNKIHQVQKD
jgi:hypothetical protein